MNRQEQLKAIRDACIKANPEIAGTHIFADGYPNYCNGCRAPRIMRDIDRKIRRVSKEGGTVTDVTMTEYKTEGQPCPAIPRREVRLADVLLAIPTLWVQPKTDVGNGTRFINSGMANSGISWKLRKDDLEEQSDECVAFVAGLFANQKQA